MFFQQNNLLGDWVLTLMRKTSVNFKNPSKDTNSISQKSAVIDYNTWLNWGGAGGGGVKA